MCCLSSLLFSKTVTSWDTLRMPFISHHNRRKRGAKPKDSQWKAQLDTGDIPILGRINIRNLRERKRDHSSCQIIFMVRNVTFRRASNSYSVRQPISCSLAVLPLLTAARTGRHTGLETPSSNSRQHHCIQALTLAFHNSVFKVSDVSVLLWLFLKCGNQLTINDFSRRQS